MNKAKGIKLTNAKAIQIDQMEIHVMDIKYLVNTSTIKINGKPRVNQMMVDAYQKQADGTWEFDIDNSAVLEPGDYLPFSEYNWAQFI